MFIRYQKLCIVGEQRVGVCAGSYLCSIRKAGFCGAVALVKLSVA
jgi:hypothetical protein